MYFIVMVNLDWDTWLWHWSVKYFYVWQLN